MTSAARLPARNFADVQFTMALFHLAVLQSTSKEQVVDKDARPPRSFPVASIVLRQESGDQLEEAVRLLEMGRVTCALEQFPSRLG